jgi:hypothetical protein
LILLAGMAYGLDLTDTQLVATMAAFESVMTLLQRSYVSPVAVVEAALKMPAGSTVKDAVAASEIPPAKTPDPDRAVKYYNEP